jgi:U3 small nucleolar ribonucleoprotein protein IMP4
MAVRRQLRERREYLYRKSLEGQERVIYERKQRIKAALREGKEIPTELRDEADELRKEVEAEDERTSQLRTHVDDEYAKAGMIDPKICVTTSRKPSSRLKQFAKEVRLLFPNSQRINRGNTKTDELVNVCRQNGFTDIVMLQEHRGEPDGIAICHLPFGPTAYFTLTNTVMRHDIENRGTISEAYPHLIFNGFESRLGERLKNVLRYLFPVPREDSRRVITFSNENDFISFRHHNYRKTGHKEVELIEIGPRFEMRPYQLRLGTLDMETAENEWVYRPYLNTTRKRKALCRGD